MSEKVCRPRAGEKVVLLTVPPGLLDGLPDEDKDAITAIVGKPVQLLDWDEDGRAELHFHHRSDAGIQHHTIWVGPEFIARHRE